MLTFFISFVMLFVIIEFVLAVLNYDDFGDNIPVSLAVAFVMALLITLLIMKPDKKVDPEFQAEAQEAQQMVKDFVTGVLDTDIKIEDEENLIAVDVVEVTTPNAIEDVFDQPLAVPSNAAYLESSRRNTSTVVSYTADTKMACIGNACFRVRLVQHTDGSYWACARNYGACYQYNMKE